MNAETFEAWPSTISPTLEESDTVVPTISRPRKPRAAEILARKNCTVRYPPLYSPDFNPIEMAISTLKSALRKLAERTVVGLWQSWRAAPVSSSWPTPKPFEAAA